MLDDGSTWHESGTALTLAPGSFTVTYQPVAGYVTPAPAAATIVAGQVTTIAGDYVAEVVDPYADWGYLQVTLTGTDAGRWTIDSGDTWHESGVTLYVPAGPYGVQFEPVNGYTTPLEQIVTVSAGQTTSVSAEYAEYFVTSLKVTLSGAAAGRWSIDDGSTWHESGTTLTLAPGSYTVTYQPVAGYVTPSSTFIAVLVDQTTTVGVTYTTGDLSADPADYGMTWINETEPSIIDPNKVIYVTPTGAGSKDGTSWANAIDGMANAMAAATSGDALYLQEGTYASPATTYSGGHSMAIYGGFTVDGGTWATRNGWTHKTIIDASSTPTVPFVSSHYITIDGLSFEGFSAGVLQGPIVYPSAKNSIFDTCSGWMAEGYNVDNCLFVGCVTGSTGANVARMAGAPAATITKSVFTHCAITSDAVGKFNDNILNPSVVAGNVEGCAFFDCTVSVTGDGNMAFIAKGDAADCVFTGCSVTSPPAKLHHQRRR